jgi:hypothetical protein
MFCVFLVLILVFFFFFFARFIICKLCVTLVYVFLSTLAHSCSLLHTIVFTFAYVTLFLFSLARRCFFSRLCTGAFSCVYLWLFLPTCGHFAHVLIPICCYSPFVDVPRLLLFHVVVHRLLLFFVCCCSSLFVFPHMVLLPHFLAFTGNLWNNKQKPTNNIVSFF